jgi:hypothetical protein
MAGIDGCRWSSWSHRLACTFLPNIRIVEKGMTYEKVTFPFDAFKTRMQAESWTTGDDQLESKSTLRQIIRYTIATQGWKACFAGLAPTLIR